MHTLAMLRTAQAPASGKCWIDLVQGRVVDRRDEPYSLPGPQCLKAEIEGVRCSCASVRNFPFLPARGDDLRRG